MQQFPISSAAPLPTTPNTPPKRVFIRTVLDQSMFHYHWAWAGILHVVFRTPERWTLLLSSNGSPLLTADLDSVITGCGSTSATILAVWHSAKNARSVSALYFAAHSVASTETKKVTKLLPPQSLLWDILQRTLVVSVLCTLLHILLHQLRLKRLRNYFRHNACCETFCKERS